MCDTPDWNILALHYAYQVGGVVTEVTTVIIPILSKLSFKFLRDVIVI